MARLESESKGGFFATPPEQTELIAKRLTCLPGDTLNLCDPCAGEGVVLSQLAGALKEKGAEVKTYGIELEEGRARKAKQVLDHVIADGYEQVRMTNQALSALYLNPPYQETRNKQREEARFLRDLTEKRLQPGGLLMFCIPQYILKNCAAILANRFKGIKIYRFTDEDYKVFKQVVLFGYRREKAASGPIARRLRDQLIIIGEKGPDALPPLDIDDDKTFAIPPAAKEITLFRDSKVTDEEVAEVLEGSKIFEKVQRIVTPPPAAKVKLATPVLPLKIAHMGTAIAAGAVGGNMGTHVVTGTTRKVVETNQRTEHTYAKTEKMITTIKVFSPTHGIVTLK